MIINYFVFAQCFYRKVNKVVYYVGALYKFTFYLLIYLLTYMSGTKRAFRDIIAELRVWRRPSRGWGRG